MGLCWLFCRERGQPVSVDGMASGDSSVGEYGITMGGFQIW